MLYTFSIPITDYRPLLEENTFRLDIDQFPRNWNDQSFLRSFGQFGERVRPGKDIPFSEKKYAKANHGIHFIHQNKVTRRGTEIIPSCVFRRMFFDPYSVRIDVGIMNISKDSQQGYIFDSADEIINTCKYFVNTKIFRTEYSSNGPQSLNEIGGDLLKQYLYATTIHPGKNYTSTRSGWLSYGCPVIVVEYEKINFRNISSLEGKDFKRFPDIPEDWGISLWYREINRHIPLYVIVKNRTHNKEKVRALRVNLLKYHQERETLRAVTKLIASKNENLDGINADSLSAYLNSITALYSRSKRDGIHQQPLFELMARIEAEINQNDCAALYTALKNNPKLQYLLNRFGKTMQNINQEKTPIYNYFISGDLKETNNIYKGDVTMGDTYNINQAGNVGPGAGANSTINQIYLEQADQNYDYKKLIEEIDQLRKHIKTSEEIGEDEKDVLAGELVELKKAVGSKDKNRIMAFMKGTGKQVFDIAKRVGCTLLAAYIKNIIGL